MLFYIHEREGNYSYNDQDHIKTWSSFPIFPYWALQEDNIRDQYAHKEAL